MANNTLMNFTHVHGSQWPPISHRIAITTLTIKYSASLRLHSVRNLGKQLKLSPQIWLPAMKNNLYQGIYFKKMHKYTHYLKERVKSYPVDRVRRKGSWELHTACQHPP